MNKSRLSLFLTTIALLLFSSLGYILYKSINESSNSKKWEVHTLDVKAKINILLKTNFLQESMVRGYLISEDSTFLENYTDNITEFNTSIRDLRNLVKDNMNQVILADSLKDLHLKKVASLFEASKIETDSLKKQNVTRSIKKSGEISFAIEDLCSEMLAIENTILEKRKRDYKEQINTSKRTLYTFLTLLGIVGLGIIIWIVGSLTRLSKDKLQLNKQNEELIKSQEAISVENESLSKLYERFEVSSFHSMIAFFDWEDTSKDNFWISNSIFQLLNIDENDFNSSVTDFFGKLMHPDDTKQTEELLMKHLQEGAIYNPEYRLRKKDGSYSWFRALGAVVDQGDTQRMTGVIINIDNEMEARQAKVAISKKWEEFSSRYELILETTQYGVWDWFDVNNESQYWSDTLYELLGTDRTKKTSTFPALLEYIHHEDQQKFTDALNLNIENGQKISIDFRIMTKSLGFLWCRAEGDSITSEGQSKRMIGVISDISRERQFIEELERSNADLQDFAYVASHDLQEPLRKIQAFGDRLKVLYDRNEEELPGVKFVDKMNDSATRMRRLIEDLLNFSRVSRENKFIDSVDLNELTKEVTQFISSAIEDSNAKIIVKDLPNLHSVNRSNLFMLFQNLFSNALKFQSENTEPIIKINSKEITALEALKYDSTLNRYQHYYEIKVIDNGIGFEEQYLSKIFTIFQRLHGRSEYKGTGIGLAVCQKICETHEGYITAESKLGKGATFIIILPIK